MLCRVARGAHRPFEFAMLSTGSDRSECRSWTSPTRTRPPHSRGRLRISAAGRVAARRRMRRRRERAVRPSSRATEKSPEEPQTEATRFQGLSGRVSVDKTFTRVRIRVGARTAKRTISKKIKKIRPRLARKSTPEIERVGRHHARDTDVHQARPPAPALPPLPAPPPVPTPTRPPAPSVRSVPRMLISFFRTRSRRHTAQSPNGNDASCANSATSQQCEGQDSNLHAPRGLSHYALDVVRPGGTRTVRAAWHGFSSEAWG
jgi:hypothetical protein